MTSIEPYDPQRTALLVVDPYTDLLSPGGKLFDLAKETMEANGCVAHMAQVLAAARDAGVHVLFVPHRRWRPGDLDTWNYAAPTQVAAARLQLFADGTWGGEFHPDFEPAPSEIVAQEHWMSSGAGRRVDRRELKPTRTVPPVAPVGGLIERSTGGGRLTPSRRPRRGRAAVPGWLHGRWGGRTGRR